jgi:hypothetical protein
LKTSSLAPIAVSVGAVCAAVAWLYLGEVGEGIYKHTPACAPIGDGTVWQVRAFTATGAVVSVVGIVASYARRYWCAVAALAAVLNLAAWALWGHWVRSGMLLPYDQFLEKMGWP